MFHMVVALLYLQKEGIVVHRYKGFMHFVWGSHVSCVGGSHGSYGCCVVVVAGGGGVVHRCTGVTSHMNGGVISHL